MNRLSLLTVLAALAFCSCTKETEAPVAKALTPDKGPEVEASIFVPGQVQVYLDDELLALVESAPEALLAATRASSGLASVMEELGVVSMERVFPVDKEFEARHREFGLHRWYRLAFNSGKPSSQAVECLKLAPGVLNARPVHQTCIDGQSYFNDPREGDQWHYHNSSPSWADVNVLPVWENYTTGSSKVIVSVVDGGIDLKHEDLAGAVIQPGDNGSKSFLPGGNAYRIVADSHGTHVAGTIGAVNNNGIGVAGLAGGNAAAGIAGVQLMSCQIFEGNKSGADDAAAIVWGADHGAVLSNNSWGFKFVDDSGNYQKDQAEATHNFYLQPNSDAYKDPIKDAIDYFNACAGMKNGRQTGPMAGGVVFFASGNEGRPYGSPACYPGCVAVGAITSFGTRSNFSNYGDWVDICAPGVDILSCAPGNGYALMSGTSMACPHLTGVAALVVSYCGGTGFTRDQLVEKLIGGGNSANFPLSYRVGPLVDALGAIAYGTGEPPAQVEDYNVSGVVSNNVTITLTVPADKDGHPAYGFRVLASESLADLQACDPRSPGESIIYGDFLSDGAKVGEKVTGTVGNLGFNKTYNIAVSAFDYGRNFSAIDEVRTLTTGGNNAPVITTTYAGDFKFHVHDRFTIPFTIKDPDKHVLNVEFDKDEKDAGALTLLESTRSGEYLLQVLGIATPSGKYRSTLKASDNYGLSAEYVIDYEVLPNHAPVQIKEIENIFLNAAGDVTKFNMDEYVEDPDGEPLSYKIDISDNSVVHVTQGSGGSGITVTALADAGLATVTLSATDAGGETISVSFKVLVRAAGQEMQAYPNPVVDVLHVSTGQNLAPAQISLFNANGAQVYSASFNCSAFEPAEINVRNAGPGIYTLRAEFGGKVYKSTIIKK